MELYIPITHHFNDTQDLSHGRINALGLDVVGINVIEIYIKYHEIFLFGP